MSRHIQLYVIYGAPLLIFFILLAALNMGVGFSLLLSLGIALAVALIEFFALRFIFSRIFPQV